jgi:hypothetical protein
MVKFFGLVIIAICGILILPSIFLLTFSIFLFDAPGSSTSPLTIYAAVIIWLGPFILGFSMVQTIRARKRPDIKALLVSAALPLFWLLMLAGSWFLIEEICGGKFVCP